MAKKDDTAPPATRAPEPQDCLFGVKELARLTGNLRKLRPNLVVGGARKTEDYSPAHKAAATLHGWTLHDQNTAEPLRLSRAAYEAALKAASANTPKLVPHAPACSPYLPACFRGESK